MGALDVEVMLWLTVLFSVGVLVAIVVLWTTTEPQRNMQEVEQ